MTRSSTLGREKLPPLRYSLAVAQQPLRATIISQLLDDGMKLQEALRFPEVRCCAATSGAG